jgi:hypothetical protein
MVVRLFVVLVVVLAAREIGAQSMTPIERYESASKVALPAKFDRQKIARALQSTVWNPIMTSMISVGPEPKTSGLKPLKLRFLKPTKVNVMVGGRSGERSVLLGKIEQRDGATLIAIDGVPWRLEPCGTKQKPRACLVPTGDAAFDN